MNFAKQPPKSPSPTKAKKEPRHWSQKINEVVVSAGSDGLLHLVVQGGAENGQFCYMGEINQDKINYHSGKLHQDEIILEIQGRKVSGYTLRDLLDFLRDVSKNGNIVMFKTIKSGLLTKDLREYLNTRFPKNSVDHDLQQTIRDNVYRRTVPCTTRSPRPGEVSGVDYMFLTVDEFLALEKSGNLLESGLFEGNQYGTPKPSKDPSGSPYQTFRRTNSMGTLLPGQTPSSEGKRRRNRSNIESGSKISDDRPREPPPAPPVRKKSLERAQTHSGLGPLPGNWEMSYTEDGTPYFIDHNTETTHWLDPRLANNQKMNAIECEDSELPYGWEKVEDPHYGTYFIDHVNRKTQYENPVSQAKRQAGEAQEGQNDNGSGNTGSLPRNRDRGVERKRSEREMNGRKSPPDYESHQRVFTKNPEELKGRIIKSQLLKSARGFGFTIVGGDNSDEEFLQIKSVVPNGPAYAEGKLERADVLVFVNDVCVLGYSHQDIVNSFQSIPVGENVNLVVCRGYPLPFDPDDPNTEIVTTVAVSMPNAMGTLSPPSYSAHRNNHTNHASLGMNQRSINSMPDLSNSGNAQEAMAHRNQSFDDDVLDHAHNTRPELYTIPIVKGPMGFGFTIADSAYGQKVKQILDKPRCKTLQEGDILVEISGIKVKDLSHSEVVEVLKQCPKGSAPDVLIQRGGMLTPVRGRTAANRSPKTVGETNFTNVPRTPFYAPDKEAGNQDSPGERVGEENNNQGEKKDSEDLVNTTVPGGRSRTPSADNRPKTPTDHLRARTPVAGDHGNEMKGRQPFTDMHNLSRQDYPGSGYDERGRGNYPHYGPEYLGATRALYDPRLDHPQGYPPKQANHSFSEGERTEYPARGHEDPRREVRSRTPGPDFMRARDREEDAYFQQRTRELRSKTPTHDVSANQANQANPPISGTPDFIPASYYTFRNRGHGGKPGGDAQDQRGHRPLSNPDIMQSYGGRDPYHPGRLNSSQSSNAVSVNNRSQNNYSGTLAGFDQSGRPLSPNAGKARKQSTSFENEEPAPSNLTRVLRSDGYSDSPSGSLDRSRSPTRFGEDKFTEMTVHLKRQENGFGFRIIGGTEEGSQVSVGHIVPGGAAAVDGRLRPGDEIMYVEGQCVIGSSHHKVVQLMGQAAIGGQVSVGVRRRLGGPPHADSPYRNPAGDGGMFPYDVTVTRRENEGFGFVIISSVTKSGSVIADSHTNLSLITADWMKNNERPYPWIGKIIENSPAARCQSLHVGDRILAVNGVDIMRMHHEEIVQLIKDSGYSVTLSVGPPQDDASSTASNPRSNQGSMMNAMAFPAHSESDLSRRSDTSPYHYPQAPRPDSRYTGKPSGGPGYSPSQHSSEAEDDKFYTVELHRGARGFGFSIRGGKEFNNMPLYVLRIADGGAADLDGRLRVGDQIIEINGFNTTNMTHKEAINLIQNMGSTVRLLVKRTGKLPPQLGSSSQQSSPGIRGGATTPLPNGPGPISQSSPNVQQRPNGSRDPYYYQYPTTAQHSRQHSGY